MAIIRTKVPNFNGYRASVLFSNGVGRTNDTRLIEWFRSHGYTVETESKPKTENKKPVTLESMTPDELRALAKAKGVYVGNTKDKDKLIDKLKEVM